MERQTIVKVGYGWIGKCCNLVVQNMKEFIILLSIKGISLEIFNAIYLLLIVFVLIGILVLVWNLNIVLRIYINRHKKMLEKND